MKKNDLIYAETSEYLEGVGAAPEVVSDYREVSKEKWQDAMTIIGTITATCNNAFYGATITPRNQADATVRCRVGHVAAIDLDALEQLLGVRPDIGFDNAGTDKETVDMVYSYPATY